MNPITEQLYRPEPAMPERPLDPPEDAPSFWDQPNADELVEALADKWMAGEITTIPTSVGELNRNLVYEHAQEIISEAAERIDWSRVN